VSVSVPVPVSAPPQATSETAARAASERRGQSVVDD